MLLNLNDPESIVRWWKVWPERHEGFLEYKLKVSPEFAPCIRQAQRLIGVTPELRALRAHLLSKRRERLVSEHEGLAEPGNAAPSYKELMAA